MSVYDKDFWGKSKVDYAIEWVQSFGQSMKTQKGEDEKLYVAFSGGKDSVVIADIVRRSGVPYELHHNITGLDYPETMKFIKNFGGVIFHQHQKSFFQLVREHRQLPMRKMRFCCGDLKEHGGGNRYVITGVRWAESVRRKNQRHVYESGNFKIFFNDNDEMRRSIEFCALRGRKTCNPIINWTDDEVWEYIRTEKLSYCELYDKGKKRIGCMFCPIARKSEKLADCEKYPKMKQNIIKTLDNVIIDRNARGLKTPSKTGEEWFERWIKG